MTLNKPITSKIESPKKAIASSYFNRPKCYFEKEHKETNYDNELQPLKKRRYMRRGSKTAEMLIQSLQYMNLAKLDSPRKRSVSPLQRRLSIVSALRLNLEASHINDTQPNACCEKLPLRTDERRSTTIDILSSIKP
jgi:hypothetical protein